MESGVARNPIEDWNKYREDLEERLGNNNKLTRMLTDRAKSDPKRVVYAEADQLDVLKAAQIVHEEGIAKPILLGRKDTIKNLMKEIDFVADDIEIIDPKIDESKSQLEKYADIFWKSRKRSGISLHDARGLMRSRSYFAAMMVNEGDADAMLSGYTRAYPTVLKPILELIPPVKGVSRIATTNLMNIERGPLFISDTSINIEPDAKTLASIAIMTANTAKMFGIEPVVAMMSYTNFGASNAPQAKKVKEAVKFLHEYDPNLLVDGEIQADFALNREMRHRKFPFSKIADHKVNTLVFPNLGAANSVYKLIKELQDGDSIGPIIMGLSKPVHILQLGASVQEMVNMSAVAVVDAQYKANN